MATGLGRTRPASGSVCRRRDLRTDNGTIHHGRRPDHPPIYPVAMNGGKHPLRGCSIASPLVRRLFLLNRRQRPLPEVGLFVQAMRIAKGDQCFGLDGFGPSSARCCPCGSTPALDGRGKAGAVAGTGFARGTLSPARATVALPGKPAVVPTLRLSRSGATASGAINVCDAVGGAETRPSVTDHSASNSPSSPAASRAIRRPEDRRAFPWRSAGCRPA